MLAETVSAQLDGVFDDRRQVLRAQRVFVPLPREGTERVDDAPDALDRPIDVVRRLAHDRRIHRLGARQDVEALGPQQDHRQRVVDLVGDAGAHLAEGGHLGGVDGRLARLGQLALRALAGGDVEPQRPLDPGVLAAALEQREQDDGDGEDEGIGLVDAERAGRREGLARRRYAQRARGEREQRQHHARHQRNPFAQIEQREGDRHQPQQEQVRPGLTPEPDGVGERQQVHRGHERDPRRRHVPATVDDDDAGEQQHRNGIDRDHPESRHLDVDRKGHGHHARAKQRADVREADAFLEGVGEARRPLIDQGPTPGSAPPTQGAYT